MALVLGTNCGFVTTAPTDDPADTQRVLDGYSHAMKDTAPEGAVKITEIGIWNEGGWNIRNFQFGVYSHNSVNNKPASLIASTINGDYSKGTKWITINCDIEITAGTVYWIAVQSDDDSSARYTDSAPYLSGTPRRSLKGTAETDLVSPWPAGSTEVDQYVAIYAVYETEAPTGTNMQINIGDAWKEISAMQINIGDSWKSVAGAQVNIGDAWKTIF